MSQPPSTTSAAGRPARRSARNGAAKGSSSMSRPPAYASQNHRVMASSMTRPSNAVRESYDEEIPSTTGYISTCAANGTSVSSRNRNATAAARLPPALSPATATHVDGTPNRDAFASAQRATPSQSSRPAGYG